MINITLLCHTEQLLRVNPKIVITRKKYFKYFLFNSVSVWDDECSLNALESFHDVYKSNHPVVHLILCRMLTNLEGENPTESYINQKSTSTPNRRDGRIDFWWNYILAFDFLCRMVCVWCGPGSFSGKYGVHKTCASWFSAPSSPDQHTGFCHQSLSKENQDRGFPGRAAAPLHFENLWASLFGNDSTLLSASPYSQYRHVWGLRDTHQACWGLQTPAVGPDADLKAFDIIVNELTDIIIVHIIG